MMTVSGTLSRAWHKVSASMTINAPAAVLLLLYELVGEKQGVPAAALQGTIQNDVLKEYIARGTYIYPPKQSMRIITDIFAFCTEKVPRWNTISISGYHIREAGSTAAQELAFTLADGFCYVEHALAADLDIAKDYFDAALEKDPSYSPPYAGRAWAWIVRNQGRLARLQGTAGRVRDYLLEHRDNRQRLKLIAISLAIRLCKYVYNFILFEGVLHLGVSLKNFSLFCFGLAATELSALLPLQGPAGFGTWELAFALVFSALQVPAVNIKEAGIVIHITSQAWEYAVGLLALACLAFASIGKSGGASGPRGACRSTGQGPSRCE